MTTFQDIEELLILFHKFYKLRIKHCTLDKFYKEIKEFKFSVFQMIGYQIHIGFNIFISLYSIANNKRVKCFDKNFKGHWKIIISPVIIKIAFHSFSLHSHFYSTVPLCKVRTTCFGDSRSLGFLKVASGARGYKRTFRGDGYIYYLGCSSCCTNLYVCQNLLICTF